MPTPLQILQDALDQALAKIDTAGLTPDLLRVVPSTNPQFGDYQFNGSLPLAKATKRNPREVAGEILAALEVQHVSEEPQIAGPGFINFRLTREFLETAALAALNSQTAGVDPVAEVDRRRVVIDYPSPNVAKPLHIGHIRPTFIGDAIARMLRFMGHDVISDNHIGDWGTPIGKVICGWKKYRDEDAFEEAPLEEMGRLYRLINKEGKEDPAVEALARHETARLQSGDPENLAIWKRLRDTSQVELDALYSRLGVKTDYTLGESFYDPMLAAVIEELVERGLATESDGALIVTFDESEELRNNPCLIRKSDGSALYATTDLATVKYRVDNWQPDEILYVVDKRQALHFKQIFATTARWGYTVKMRHVDFGTIQGADGKAISTRDGVTSNLSQLVDEAQRRAQETAREINPDLNEEQLGQVGRVVGLGALKYADLLPNRSSDYQFSWEKMLALNGNSAVYLEYAYVRTRSLRRMASSRGIAWFENPQFQLENKSEQDLVRACLRFGEVLETVLVDYRPHILCEYLYELAGKYSAFWRDCRVLDEEVPEPLRHSRMALADLTGNILQRGLQLLGIETVESM